MIPDSQRTYAEVNGTNVLRTNVGSGNDVIHAGAGDDVVNAGAGDDTVFAGSGVDIVAGYDGDDFIEGGDDADRLYGDYQAFNGDAATLCKPLFLFGAPIVTRTTLEASRHGRDYLDGGAGDDFVFGGGLADEIHGGSGNDFLFGDDDGRCSQLRR